MSRNFWDDRYTSQEYAYGTEPNNFLKEQLKILTPGTILFPAEGEGRNAVYAAEQGWNVLAFDQSGEGRRKALALADSKGVRISYLCSDWEEFKYPVESVDVVAMIYVHPSVTVRKDLHQRIVASLKPGGQVILEGFSKDQVQFTSGGPKDRDMLFSIDEIRSDFTTLIIQLLKEERIHLTEGQYHCGEASVIRFLGKKL